MRWSLMVAVLVVACGGKIAGEGLDGSAPIDDPDASSSPPPAPTSDAGKKHDGAVPPGTVPYGTFCYEGATTSGVTCHAEGTTGSGATCQTSIDCEGHKFRALCEDGLCQCINEGYSQCFCHSLAADACGATGNCCWRP